MTHLTVNRSINSAYRPAPLGREGPRRALPPCATLRRRFRQE